MKNIFYVYALFDAAGVVRYIGKGRGGRINDHQMNGAKGNRAKLAFVRHAIETLGDLPKVKIREDLLEDQAFELEKALIAAIGRLDLKTGPLTNMSDGGTGGDFGDVIRRVKQKWTPEQRAIHQETYRKSTRDFWQSLSPEEQASRTEKFLIGSRAALADLWSDPDWVKRRNSSIRRGWSRRTEAQKAKTIEKIRASVPSERRSQAIKAFHSSQTEEERKKRVVGSLTAEQRSERSRRAQASIPAEIRSMKIRIQQENLTAEQKSARIDRAKRLALGTIWINDGGRLKRHPANMPIPPGWRRGKKI